MGSIEAVGATTALASWISTEFSADAQPKQQEVCRLLSQITSTAKQKKKQSKQSLFTL